jgi:hypothetical protein
MAPHLKPGDCVVYRKQKVTAHPGRHARNIFPAPNGDYYTYFVKKFYRVLAVLAGHRIVVLTKRGRQHTLEAEDPALRRAHWWERLLLRHRFPPLDQASSAPGD